MPCGLQKAGSCSAWDRSDGMGDAQAFDVQHNTANDYINRPIYSTSYGYTDLLFVVGNQGREMKKSYKPLQNGTTYLCLCGGKARMHCTWCAYCKSDKYFSLAGRKWRTMQGTAQTDGSCGLKYMFMVNRCCIRVSHADINTLDLCWVHLNKYPEMQYTIHDYVFRGL